jgi:hypothetical protein
LATHIDRKLEEANAAIEELPAPLSENPERVMRNLCRTYISEIERYTQCHDQEVFKHLKRGFAELILAIAETRPNFHITFEEINHREAALNANGDTTNDIRPQLLLPEDRTPRILEGETLPST